MDEENISKNLERFAAAGLGGVHIIPIYGAMGYEDRYLPFLSPRWMRMLAHTVQEAERLGMGVDMTTGTGWPYGGPQIGKETGAHKVRIDRLQLDGGTSVRHSFGEGKYLALEAVSDRGEKVNLTGKLSSTGELEWDAPPGKWTMYCLAMEETGQKVKRAAPGGEGLVMDYFSSGALNAYVSRFDHAFADSAVSPVRVRAFYNDSYEAYGANWTGNLLREFKKRRGYDLLRYLPEFAGDGDSDRVKRIRHDYNETVSDLLLEEFARPWTSWAHWRGSFTRSQSHGSPGNILDLYAAADIPETEIFGPSGFPIPGLRIDTDYPENSGKPDILVGKFASSAAHVTGKPLVSSESCTWLGEHFKVALSQVKPEIDALFLAGINHVFFHGIAYSPVDEPWPGWLFYASTDFTPFNTIWRDMPALSAYISRCQAFLRSGKPANDILLYWPVHDRWMESADADMLHHFQVHNTDEWLYGTPFHDAARQMWARGYTFDYVSDRQTGTLSVSRQGIEAPGGTYRIVLVPGCRYMPAATLGKLAHLVRSGATVVFLGSLPGDIPGMGSMNRERAHFHKIEKQLFRNPAVSNGMSSFSFGKGRVLSGENIEALLDIAGVRREPVTDSGVSFIRRIDGDGYGYFITNLGARSLEGWVSLGVDAESAMLSDPLTGSKGRASVRKNTRRPYRSIPPA